MQVRSLKEQYKIIDEILKARLDTVLQPLMAECGIDTWVIAAKEYNEDPLFKILTPAGFPTARRLSILVFHNNDTSVDKYCVNLNYPELSKYYTLSWDPKTETQMEALGKLLARLNPKTIGLNYSDEFAYCDGMTVGILEMFKKELPKEIVEKFVSADVLGVRYLETRTDLELEYYSEVMAVAMDVITEAYSRQVITPGVTTCSDVEWFMKQKTNNLGLTYWFEPTIDVQRPSGMFSGDEVILPGDMIHCDYGLVYLGLCTDTQRLGYVLKDDEKEVPEFLVAGMEENNRFQDIVCSKYIVGNTGNDVFTQSIAQAKNEGIQAMLYTHPLGNHGHAAGPTIGLFTNQNPIPVKGDVQVNDRTCYALELNTARDLVGYEKTVWFYTEESVAFVDGQVRYLASGREKIMVI